MTRWGQRWDELLDDGNAQLFRRLVQGRNLLRSGRVTGVTVGPGTVTAKVQGTSATPLAVEIEVPQLSDDDWTVVVTALASQVRHRARLLAGQVPDGLDSQLEARGLSLLPDREHLDITCRCGDPIAVCTHAAGAWFAAGREIDADPFVLLRVRGRGRERLLAESAGMRSAGTQAPPGVGLAELAGRSWTQAVTDVDDFTPAPPEPPRTVAGPLRLLGDPPGWAGGVSAGDLFAPLVAHGAAWAAALLDDPAALPGQD